MMIQQSHAHTFLSMLLVAALGACSEPVVETGEASTEGMAAAGKHSHDDSVHEHSAGDDHGDEGDGHAAASLGTVDVEGLQVELAQGHGAVAAGHEAHLVVKLPFADQGASVVRAWLGTEDRTLSYVGKGEYTASSGGYDIHATAPDPLPEDAKWWVEIVKPDGTTHLGSAAPIVDTGADGESPFVYKIF